MMDQNAYIINLEGSSECVVIDPGMADEELVSTLKSQQLKPVALLCTHGHYDHIKGVTALREAFPGVPTYIGVKDADKFGSPRLNLSRDFDEPTSFPDAEKTVSHGDVLSLAGLEFEVREAPGHTAGHVIYILREDLPYGGVKTMLFCGDVLFAGSVGRTDFYDGNTEKLINSIKTQILTLPDDTIVYSGHSKTTTVEREKIYNPYF